jgi:hypothetical protein
MTQREWWANQDPLALLYHVERRASPRKLRLFACACCRRALNPFVPPFVLRAVAAAEAFADGALGARDLARVRRAVERAAGPTGRAELRDGTFYFREIFGTCLAVCHSGELPGGVAELARDAAHAAASAAADASPAPRGSAEWHSERAGQADLFRDIFGDPFHPTRLDPAWLTSDVSAVARGIYASRAFSAMPVLADALQEAGCTDDTVLHHCREPREHARGCWVLDLLLGTETMTTAAPDAK